MNSYYDLQKSQEALAYAYVKWQKMEHVFESLSDALQVGTIFPELEKPFVRGNCPNGRR